MAAANPLALHLVRLPISSTALLLLFLVILTHNTSPLLLVLAKNFTVGETLSTSDPPMQSPSGDFSFGFHPLPHPNNGSDDQTYLLSIWYTKIPETTIVWYANQDGNTAPKGSTLALTSTDGLVLKNPNNEIIWKPPIDNGGVVDHSFLSNAGNLIVSTDRYQSLWQSFTDPRDTLLPTQKITEAGASGKGANPILYSRRKENDFSRGRFLMRLQDGVFQLARRNPITNQTYDDVPRGLYAIYYWSSGDEPKDSTWNPGYSLSYNDSGQMYIVNSTGDQIDQLTPAATSLIGKQAQDHYYFRATLNFDGVFAWYYYPKNTSATDNKGRQDKKNGTTTGWQAISSVPEDICTSLMTWIDSGTCGYNSICSLGKDQRPNCECPSHYSLVDPNNPKGDCGPDFEISTCGTAQKNSRYTFQRLENVDWPQFDYDRKDSADEEFCKNWCMDDCFCAVAILRGQTCWKKKLPLSNGKRDNTTGGVVFIKMMDGNSTYQIEAAGSKRRTVVISSVLVTSAVFILVLVGAIGLILWVCRRKKPDIKGYASLSTTPKHNGKFNTVCCFTYRELQEATDGFKQELGRGACAIVYKGNMPERYSSSPSGRGSHDQAFIAVKRIDRASLGEAEKEFIAEVNIIGQTHHKNLVKLIGFCEEEEHKMLVYEYMSHGSLAAFLFGDLRPSWALRSNIAKGIAMGLLYLHEECSTQIIHCDIKPQNILLDESYQAKISDFGLSKLLKLNQFHTRTAVRGTKGYVAPEWFRSTMINAKVDVYSFGVLLLEIVSCRRSIDFLSKDEDRAVLTDFAINCYECGDWASLVGDDKEALLDMHVVERFLKVAIWCIQDDRNLRPTMRRVTLMLEGVVNVPMPPLPDADSSSVSATTQTSLPPEQ